MKVGPVPSGNSFGRLFNSLHGSGFTILVPGFDCDSFGQVPWEGRRLSAGSSEVSAEGASPPVVTAHSRGLRARQLDRAGTDGRRPLNPLHESLFSYT